MDMLKQECFRLLNMERHERITLAVEGCGKKQNAIAKFCGVTPGSITQWKTGDTKDLRLEPFLRLCEITKTSPWWMALGEGEMRMEIGGDPFIEEMKALDSTERAIVLDLISGYRKLMAGAAMQMDQAGRKWTDEKETKSAARLRMLERGRLPPPKK